MADSLLQRLRGAQEWFSDGHGYLHKESADEIDRLQGELEYAYRCINAGFDGGSFDFSVLRERADAHFNKS